MKRATVMAAIVIEYPADMPKDQVLESVWWDLKDFGYGSYGTIRIKTRDIKKREVAAALGLL